MEFGTVLLILGLPVAVALSAYIAGCAADNFASAYKNAKGHPELLENFNKLNDELLQEKMKNIDLAGKIAYLKQHIQLLEGKQ